MRLRRRTFLGGLGAFVASIVTPLGHAWGRRKKVFAPLIARIGAVFVPAVAIAVEVGEWPGYPEPY